MALKMAFIVARPLSRCDIFINVGVNGHQSLETSNLAIDLGLNISQSIPSRCLRHVNMR